MPLSVKLRLTSKSQLRHTEIQVHVYYKPNIFHHMSVCVYVLMYDSLMVFDPFISPFLQSNQVLFMLNLTGILPS